MSRKPDTNSAAGRPGFRPEDNHPVTRQLVLDLGHTPSYEEDDFVVAACNELAWRHVTGFPAWPGPLSLLIGPTKSGKSHLGAIWMRRAGARMISPSDFDEEPNDRDLRPLLVEDADSGNYPESGLFHLLNRSIRANRPVLMTAASEPQDWPLVTEDARSRARLATALHLEPPDDALLSQLFVKLFSDRQIAVEPGLVSYLVKRMERAPDEVVALVDIMDRVALSRGTAITRSVAAEAIALRAAVHNTEPNDSHG